MMLLRRRQKEFPRVVDLLEVGDNFFLPLFRGILQEDFAITDNPVLWGARLIVQVDNEGFQIEGDVIRGKFLGIQQVIDDG